MTMMLHRETTDLDILQDPKVSQKAWNTQGLWHFFDPLGPSNSSGSLEDGLWGDAVASMASSISVSMTNLVDFEGSPDIFYYVLTRGPLEWVVAPHRRRPSPAARPAAECVANWKGVSKGWPILSMQQIPPFLSDHRSFWWKLLRIA